MSQRSAILHIGLHKTGSTTLQYALVTNRVPLRDQGVFYSCEHLPSKTQHSHLALFLRTGQTDQYQSALRAILDDFGASGCSRIVLSGEEFSTLKAELVDKVYKDLATEVGRIEVVLYVRNLYKFMSSLVAQYSKGADTIIYPHVAISRLKGFNPSDVLRRWEAVAGEANVTVRCLDKLPEGKTIVESFADFAAIQLPLVAADSFANRSADAIAASLQSHLAFEFGLTEPVFYRAYFSELGERFSLPRIEARYFDQMEEWVRGVDLSHPKLRPFDEVMRARPAVTAADGDSSIRLAEYLGFMSAVLNRARMIVEAGNRYRAAS
ncbi:MAG TPA: hypothetical protein VME92_19210 [Acetobacteraceae bacterium]|nr:hypothetical protein [Acetobacteraceae bacterium]